MSSGAIRRRLLLWVLFVGFSALGLAYLPYAFATLPPPLGNVTFYWVLLIFAGALGLGTLVRVVGSSEQGITRTMCRIVAMYLLYELLVVIPVALWLGTHKLTAVLAEMGIRATWLLLPVMLVVCADERARRRVGAAVLIAATCLITWGVYAAATGGGGTYNGYYVEGGHMRYRILGDGATLLAAWPFVLAMSGALPRRYSAALLVLAGVSLVLTGRRTDLIAYAVTGLVCLAMSGKIRRILPAMVPIALVAIIFAIIWGRQLSTVFSYPLLHLFDIGSGGGADRMMRWRLAWDFIVSHPFNDFVWSWRRYLVSTESLATVPYPAHNFVLEVAQYEGVAGLVFYGSMLWTALRGARDWVRRDAETRAVVGWLVMYVVFSLVNANHYLPTSMPLLVGALAALAARVDWLRRTSGQGPLDVYSALASGGRG